MKFDIRDYMWQIFQIAFYNNITNIRIGLDLFLMNLELKRERYRGSTNISYRKIGNLWNDLTEAGQVHQKLIFNRIIHLNYLDLCKAYKDRRRDIFNKLCRVDLSMFDIDYTDLDKVYFPTKSELKCSNKKKKFDKRNHRKNKYNKF